MLLMEYIDGIKFDEIDSEYDRSKILNLLSIFTSNSCLYNISHGDLHIGNWSIIMPDKLIIYDWKFVKYIFLFFTSLGHRVPLFWLHAFERRKAYFIYQYQYIFNILK